MGEAFLDYKKGGSGLNINGIIEDYYVYAGEKVSAGDFVEFINGVAGKVDRGESSMVELSVTEDAGERVKAVALDDNRVLVLHAYGTNYYLYGMVCTIEGANIMVGEDIALESVKGAGSYFEPLVLPSGLVLILNGYTSANFKLRGILAEVSGTNITVKTTAQLTGHTYCYNKKLILLSDNKVFVALGPSGSTYLYGLVITISGTSMSTGNALTIDSDTAAGPRMSLELLEGGNVFVAYTGTSGYLYYAICGIEGTNVTKKSNGRLSAAKYSGVYISTAKLQNEDIFIAHSYDTEYHLYGMVCKVSDTTVTAGTDTAISAVNYATHNNSVCPILLDNGDVFIAHNHNGIATTYYLYGVVCSVNDTTITAHEDTQLSDKTFSGYYISVVKLKNGNIFIAHNNSGYNYLASQLFSIDETNKVPTKQITETAYETQVRPATSLPCKGVAKNSGEGGDSTGHKDIVSVYRMPYSVYNLIKNGDFSNGLEGWTVPPEYTTTTVTNGECKCEVISTLSSGSGAVYLTYSFSSVVGHIYYASANLKTEITNKYNVMMRLRVVNSSFPIITGSTNESWQPLSLISEANTTSAFIDMIIPIDNIGDIFYFDNIKCYDLTEIFGAGNEPTQEWCDANL